jgi:tetratricopeptide (TPR) repeat protein
MPVKSPNCLLRFAGIWMICVWMQGFAPDLFGQAGTVIDLPKPKKYENRVLASEKTVSTKSNFLKRWNQNLNTRFNFAFNAATILEGVVGSAKQSFKDDYTQLLPFYNFALQNTKAQEKELDSIIHKCNNGILLHDLRSDWIDDLYLLMGQAYFYQELFDSALITFQYINYAFQPKNKDEVGYDKYIGSNVNTSGNVYTISTPEKKNAVLRAVSHSPARNESLLWLTRTLIEQNRMGEAWGLMETLRRDQNFPTHLEAGLHEMKAYYYYKLDQPDSAAVHLEKALPSAGDLQERSRWEYLTAQLYERVGKKEQADGMYEKAIGHTTDPILEAYARIAQIRLATGEDGAEKIRKNIEALMSMAKKARYEEYRHIIYFAASQLEIDRRDTSAAIAMLRKSLATNTNDNELKNASFVRLADLAYEKSFYQIAAAYYDSSDLEPLAPEQQREIESRKILLADIVFHLENIRVEDSLQKIALLPEKEQEDYIRTLSRKLRKEKGLKDDLSQAGGTSGSIGNNPLQSNEAPDLFSGNGGSKGEWYFYNASLKGQGQKQFESKWGNRPNLDNWRRKSAVNAQLNAVMAKENLASLNPAKAPSNQKTQPTDLTMAGLKANLPLTAEAMEISRDTVEHSLYQLGKLFNDKLGDCIGAIRYYEELLNRFPQTVNQEEALFVLTVCYQKNGNTAKSGFYKGFLQRDHGQGRYIKYLNNPEKLKEETNAFSKAATQSYEEVYNLFIEGKFDQALELKKKADNTYGDHFWTAQLLYIESVYYIRQRQDSLAIETLKKIPVLYPQSVMIPRVKSLIDVVSRRNEIEFYLSNLNVQPIPDDSIAVVQEPVKPRETEKVQAREKKPESAPVLAQQQPIASKNDTSAFKVPKAAEETRKGYQFKPAAAHFVVLVLDKVDVVYVNEARMALGRFNKEKFYQIPLELTPLPLTEDIKMVQVGMFPDVVAALDYVDKARSVAATEIFPWLPAGKYLFLPISQENLDFLKTTKKVDEYKQFLHQQLPGKF